MAKRYKRREFLIDASFMLGASVLLKLWEVPAATSSTNTDSSDNSLFTVAQASLKNQNRLP